MEIYFVLENVEKGTNLLLVSRQSVAKLIMMHEGTDRPIKAKTTTEWISGKPRVVKFIKNHCLGDRKGVIQL